MRPVSSPTRQRYLYRSALFALSLILLGCGSGGSGPITNCDLNAFTPNYARQLSHLFNWSSFPITVYFERDAEFSLARRTIALNGFDQWVTATGGKLSYNEVSSAANADLVVRFDPTTADGSTTSHFTGLEVTKAEMLLGIKNQPATDLECVAAHEFGHALGIDGHSDDPDDLMYPIHYVGTLCPITTRDLNTMKTGYCHLFGRCVTPETRSRAVGTGSVTIK